MKLLHDALALVHTYGLYAVLLAIVVLVVQDPDRGLKLKALLWELVYLVFHLGARQYLAARVGASANTFFRDHVLRFLPSSTSFRLKIRWVRSPTDPILDEEGTLILRLEETRDQTRNILAASRVAMPHFLYPTLRTNLDPMVQSAIDLAVLRRLAATLGRHSFQSFQKYFLQPELGGNAQALALFKKLVELDNGGLLVSIFIEELNLLGDDLFSQAVTEDMTGDVISMLEFLLRIANRKFEEEVPLSLVGKRIKVAIIIVAKAFKATQEGASPYLNRVNLALAAGCDSVYLYAYESAFEFFDHVTKIIDSDVRLSLVANNLLKRHQQATSTGRLASDVIRLACFRRTYLESDSSFSDRLAALGVSPGAVLTGVVIDVSESYAVINVQGVNGIVSRNECSWYLLDSCTDVMSVGHNYDFRVNAVDDRRERIELSRRLEGGDPWATDGLARPNVGETITLTVQGTLGVDYIGRCQDVLEIIVPRDEVSWRLSDFVSPVEVVGNTYRAKVLSIDAPRRTIVASIRQTEPDPWPAILIGLPKGSRLRGSVRSVSHDGCLVDLPGGFVGLLSRVNLVKAGYEYEDFENSMVPGQGIDVVVTKVSVSRQRIRLDLSRNVIAVGESAVSDAAEA